MLIGRESERGRIDRLLKAAGAGQGGTVVVRGEPGIGKTALLDYAVGAASMFTVLTATGVETEVARVFGGVSDLIHPLHDRSRGLPGEQAASVKARLGQVGSSDVARSAASVFSLLSEISRARPVLLAIDDVWWLDEVSRDVVLFLARRSDLGGFAVLLCSRDSGAAQLGLRGVEELRLSGLTAEQAAVLIGTRASVKPNGDVARRLVAQTRGNPLALVELARLLSPAELVGRSPIRRPLPVGENVEALFSSLVDGLDEGAFAASLAAAASDRRDLAMLTEVAARLGADVDSFERAELAGLLRLGGGEVVFRHPLLRSVVYQRADPGARRAVHRELARVEPDLQLRARNLAAAATAPDESVASALEDAAREARNGGALADAAASLAMAARLSPDRGEAIRRWLAAAQSAHSAGSSGQALAAAEEVLAASDDLSVRADAALVKGMALDVSERPTEAARLLEAHAECVAGVDRRRCVSLLSEASGCWFHAMEFGQALADMRRCQDLVGTDTEDDLLVRLSIGNALSNMGRAAEARPLLEPGVLQVEAVDDLAAEPALASTAATALMHLERFARARALLARQADQERRSGALSILARTLALIASVEMHSGEWPASAIAAEEVARLASDLSQPMIELWGHVMRAQTAAAQGDDLELETRLALASGLAGGTGLRRVFEIAAAEARGLAYLGRGEYELAAGVYATLEGLDTTLGSGSLSRWLPELAEAYLRAGRRTDAHDVLVRLEQLHSGSGQAWAQAAIARLHGLVEDQPDDWFPRALEQGRDAENAFERARTALCYGERLRRAGDRSRSRAQLAEALATFSRLNARPWIERAEAELRASGQTRAPQRSYQNVLTPSEQQVAALAADGLSNREIAMRLFVSIRTVEMHLSNTYRKLGLRSRAGLARHPLTQHEPAEHERISH